MKVSMILKTATILVFCGIFFISCKKDPERSQLEAHPIDGDRSLPYSYPNWMANIDGAKYLSEITIPGTHDCGADLHTSAQGVLSDYVIAQDFRIANQLLLGVRWFDIRLNDDGGTMTVYHGSYYLHKNFNDLVRPVLDFLTSHPTETVVFMIKQEHSSRSDYDFANGVLGYMNWSYPDRFWMGDYIPQLKDVRGKVVVTRQFWSTHGYELGVPLLWNDNTTGSYGSSDNNTYLYVQDHYSLNTVGLDTKISEIEACVAKAHAEPFPHRCYYLNFTSGEQDVQGPNLQDIAAYINPRINSFLLARPTWHNNGVIFVNFAGGSDDGTVPNDLVKTIINCNEFITPVPYVTIGNQIWMSKNLNVTHYRNGDPIHKCTDNTEWASLKTGAYCYYNNDSTNYASAGILYNWYAVNDARGLAPSGWQVASESNWTTLINNLGGSGAANKLKEAGTTHWGPGNTAATNSSGFTALPNNIRSYNGSFVQLSYIGCWWSSSPWYDPPGFAEYYLMSGNSPDVALANNVQSSGRPVRIVRE